MDLNSIHPDVLDALIQAERQGGTSWGQTVAPYQVAGDVVPIPFPGVNSMMYLPPELYKNWLTFGQNPGMSTQQSQPSIFPWNPGLGWSPSFGPPANQGLLLGRPGSGDIG